MRPITQRQWRARFAAELLAGMVDEKMSGETVRQVVDHCHATAREAADHERQHSRFVWRWTCPEDEAQFELACREVLPADDAAETVRRQLDDEQLGFGGPGFVVIGVPPHLVPEHMRPPFMLSGR